MMTRLARIRLLLLDVDGILTDGRIIYDDRGGETKGFNVRDGHGMKMLQRYGIRMGIITGRQSPVVERRAAELGVEIVYQAAKDKLIPFREILARTALDPEQIAYMGDDVVDLPILLRVGFAATAADAHEDVRPHVHFVSRHPGGGGAVREVCDLLLRAGGHWDEAMGRYLDLSR